MTLQASLEDDLIRVASEKSEELDDVDELLTTAWVTLTVRTTGLWEEKEEQVTVPARDAVSTLAQELGVPVHRRSNCSFFIGEQELDPEESFDEQDVEDRARVVLYVARGHFRLVEGYLIRDNDMYEIGPGGRRYTITEVRHHSLYTLLRVCVPCHLPN